jgi:hypothetical protein
MKPEDLSRHYFCPLCRSNHFKLVVVQLTKTKQRVVVDGLYQCAGCSSVFTDPQAFTKLMQDSIVNMPRYRDRWPTREYPPDAVTVFRRTEPEE